MEKYSQSRQPRASRAPNELWKLPLVGKEEKHGPGNCRPAGSEKGFVLVDLIINYFLSAISVMAPASFQVLSAGKKNAF